MIVDEIYNALWASETLLTSGQPTEGQLKAISADGFTAVINLAPSNSRNALPDEAGVVRSLDMAYFHIPVAWDNPQPADFTAFEQAMSQLPTGKTLIHCAANFRVTAFYSLYAQKHLGWSELQANAFRAKIWQGSDFPIWETFLETMKNKS